MKNKFWIFYTIAVSLVLSFGMVSGAPTVEDISNPSISLVANETNNTQQVICRYSDDDGYSNISYSDSYFDLGSLVTNNKVYFNNSSVNVSSINSTYANATIFIDQIPYYRSPGNYPVTCEVNDTNSSDSLTEDVSVNSLLASDVNVSSVDFGSLSPGESSVSNAFKVENFGNVKLNSSWNGTDFSTIGISNVSILTKRNLTTYDGGGGDIASCTYYACDNDEPFENYKAKGLRIDFYGYCSGGGWVEFNVHTSEGDVLLRNDYVPDSEGYYSTNSTDLDVVYYGYDVDANCTRGSYNFPRFMVRTRDINGGWWIWNVFDNEKTLSHNTEFFTNVRMQSDIGELADNKEYISWFRLSVPLGTPAGSYSNTFTHSISQA